MHIHLPKPLHGWREFLGEVGIIVIGVLIALGAEELIQTNHWQREVREARESMDAQLAASKFASLERIKGGDCTDRQLTRLDDLIEAPELPALPSLRLGGLRTWTTSTWAAASASGAVAHMQPEVRNLYADQFAFAELLGEMNRKEFELVSDLRTIERHPRLEPISRDRLARDISAIRAMNKMLILGARQWVDSSAPLHLRVSQEDQDQLRKPRACPLPDAPLRR